ncbi:guanine deaminase [Atheta coriaria]|uniref:guanine deaminase n=1 Tax=Dalotia coriaria TaxID=877792 RepID=UPI0031F3B5EE
MTRAEIFIGTIINPSKDKISIDVIENGFIIVNDSKIVGLGQHKDLENTLSTIPELSTIYVPRVTLKKNQFLIPGFIDTHIHAPQYPNAGLGYDEPLLEWLNKYTYNLESKYSDLKFSEKVYNAVVNKTLSYGTTTACYFASMFKDSSLVLVNAAIDQGQRAFIGKINMIRLAPDNYVETAVDSLNHTVEFIETVIAKGSDLVQPVITPRFALSVDAKLMSQLGLLAQKYNLVIQTHISENVDEVEMVHDMYNGSSYADVYNAAGLLTKKTVLAHGVYLTEEERTLLAAKGTSISHCPNSNTRLKSGLCDVRKLQESGINIGLGTDVAGGASASIIDAMRCAIDTSTHLTHMIKDSKPITYYEAFYMATMGGAIALDISDKVGSLEVGKDFDALIVDMDVPDSSAHLLEDYAADELLQKFVFLGDDRNVQSVYVAGKKVK